MATDDPTSYASKTDDELRALERDGSLSPDAWKAVTAELWRREQQRGSGAGPGGPPSAPAAPGQPARELEEEPRMREAFRQLRALLVPGETLEAVAIQRRLFALTHRRVVVAATSGRFIFIARGLFGGYTPIDVRWQDVSDAKLKVGIFGADLTLASLNQEDLATAETSRGRIVALGLRQEQAERVYRVCQAQEQSWREKRRIRDLDELRAKSGGIQIGAGAAGVPAAGADARADDPVARLQRAKEMLQNRLITDAEYEAIKAKIVNNL